MCAWPRRPASGTVGTHRLNREGEEGPELTTYEIVITDVTQYGSLYCVAGWDLQDGGMI